MKKEMLEFQKIHLIRLENRRKGRSLILTLDTTSLAYF
jgi:hypothetical protein